MRKNKINRNSVCPKCTSGKKYKHCCGHHSKQHISPTQAQVQTHYDRHLANELRRQQQQGRGRPMLSAKLNGQQIVAVGNTVFSSDSWKTPADFLGSYIKSAFARDGRDWGTEELKKPFAERHPILQWYQSLCELQQKTLDASKEIQEYAATNAVTCYLGLAYNLYLLQHNVELQDIYIKRLKDIHNFQGTYYELMVAGCLIRAGFKLELEDETNNEFKHCEFSAISLTTGKKYWVEAKARSVAGVLGKSVNGTISKDPTSSLSKQINAAFKKPAADERLIFVDVNTPIENGVMPAWIERANKKLEQMESDTPDDKKAYVFVTNMGFHWHPEEQKVSHAAIAFGFHIPDFSKAGHYRLSEIYRMKKKHIDAHEIMDAIKEYPALPNTFDGQLPSIAYDREEAPPIIGERYGFDDGKGGVMEATVTTAIVSEPEKRMYIGLDNGQMLTREMSDRLVQDYQRHPDTFFGVILEQGKRFEEDDDYGFFEQMVKNHMDYERDNLLNRMKGWPNQDALKALPHEELVMLYCEGLVARIKEMREERQKNISTPPAHLSDKQ
ncbi:MAG: hypothetical protein DI626_04965 [Micavibrio aeruginosavorus]|uniref:SEC-C domain-containing protein n=1 Tax=Micavibrio aeruginosavorus TaxID=349221 RepID=A0A2W4ZXJ0_9BACT|nr:MAG: hypothetical protein DI626_04965 [Micavibrio aeruginosavorus]